MKGSNSRFSHRPAQRYSNLFQVQGGMVTDADLAEAGQIGQARAEALAADAIGSGVPARGGAVALAGGAPALVPGRLVAEGKPGLLAAAPGPAPAGPLGLMTWQADLPFAPAVPAGPCLLYADVWERPVFASEDPDLADAGLHGAETSYRSRTMVQLKAAPAASAAALDALADDLAKGRWPFQRRGDAVAGVAPKAVEIALDDCDPCADRIEVDATVPNALFRVEVIAVARAGAAPPAAATLAWSFENAAAMADAALMADPAARDAFARPQAVYEFLSAATEAHAGVLPGGAAQRPKLQEALNPPPAPGGDNGGDPYPMVRRWDGAATIDLATGAASAEMGIGRFTPSATTPGRVELALDGFSFLLDFAGKDFLPGDYWLVELRRFAAEDLRVRLAPAGADGLPLGIVHRFCPLFRIDAGAPLPLSGAERRRLSFPGLADLPATHVAYEPACPGLYDNARTVAQALDALCNLDATEVAFDPGADCERFAGTRTVAEALGRLCKVEADDTLTRALRLMMDWGVVCGLRVALPRAGASIVTVSPGTALDRAGRLFEVPGGDFDLRELAEDAVHGDLAAILGREELCLAVALDETADPRDRRPRLHLAAHSEAFGPAERSFAQAVAACLEGRKPVRFGDKFAALDANRAKIAGRVVSAWINKDAMSGAVPLGEAEAQVADAFIATLADDFRAVADPEESARVDRLMAQAEREIVVTAVTGEARDKRRMQLAIAKIGVLALSDEERLRGCQCANALPPCPPAAGKPPHLVPIACLKGRIVENRPAALAEVCDLCCRKQAATWRSFIYLNGHPYAGHMNKLEDLCCRREPDPGRGDFIGWLDKYRDKLYPREAPRLPPIVADWPPRPPFVRGLDDLVVNPRVFLRPDVADLDPRDARDILTGSGFEVVESIDIGAAGALDRIEALAGAGKPLNARMPEPGDKVALLTRGGTVAEFVLVEKGAGRLPFETASERASVARQVDEAIAKIDFSKLIDRTGAGAGVPGVGGIGVGGVEVGGIEGRLAEIDRKRVEAEAGVAGLRDEVAALEARRGQVLADTQAAEASLLAAVAARERLGQEVAALDGRIQVLAGVRAETEAAVARARDEFAAMKDEHGKALDAMRRAQPLETIVTDANVAAALRGAGVFSVGDLDSLTPAATRKLDANPAVGGQAALLKSVAANLLRR